VAFPFCLPFDGSSHRSFIGFFFVTQELHIVKDVAVVFLEDFSSIHPSCHPFMDGIIQGRKS
jgi:hypothetical protein